MPLTPVYTFVAHTKAEAAKVNANFALFEQCANIAGDTFTGTLNVRAIIPVSSASYDLGSSSNKFRDLYISGTANLPSIASTSINVTGINFTTVVGNPSFSGVPVFDTFTATTGNITTVNATTVNATLVGNGVGVTSISESNITDGSLLARVAANETISGTWTFGSLNTSGGVIEHSRAFAAGATQNQTYNSGLYFGVSGGSWTVDNADQQAYSYRIIGDTVWINISLINTTVTGNPTHLFISTPIGLFTQENLVWQENIKHNGAYALALITLTTSGTVIQIDNVAGWTASSNNTDICLRFAVKCSGM